MTSPARVLWFIDRVTPVSDLELLTIQREAALDPMGRLAGKYGVTIACVPGAHALWIGDEVPDTTAAELAAVFAASAPPRDPADPPPALDACRRIIEAGRARLHAPDPDSDAVHPLSTLRCR